MKDWLLNLLIALLALFAPARELFIATGILILGDFVTGVMAAYKSKEPITSAGIRRTVSKMLVYNIAVGSGFLVQHYLMNDTIPVSNIVSSAIGLVELKSILENIDRLNGGSLLKGLIEKLGSTNDSKNDTQKKSDA